MFFGGQRLPPIFPVGADKAFCERLMSTDPFEPLMTFKPRIAGKRSEVDPHRVPLLRGALKRRLQASAKQKQPAGEKQRSGIASVAEPSALSRRCLVKSHYVPMDGGGRDAARLHLDYLERDGEGDGSSGELHGADDMFDRDTFGEELPGERRQFRFIVSPEDAGELDLHGFARQLMARMVDPSGLIVTVNFSGLSPTTGLAAIRGDPARVPFRHDGRSAGVPPPSSCRPGRATAHLTRER